MPPGAAIRADRPRGCQAGIQPWARRKWTRRHWGGSQGRSFSERRLLRFPKYAEAFNNLGQVEIQPEGRQERRGGVPQRQPQIDPTLQEATMYLGQFYYEEQGNTKDAEP